MLREDDPAGREGLLSGALKAEPGESPHVVKLGEERSNQRGRHTAWRNTQEDVMASLSRKEV